MPSEAYFQSNNSLVALDSNDDNFVYAVDGEGDRIVRYDIQN